MHAIEGARFLRAVALVAGALGLLVHAAAAEVFTPAAVVESYERAWGAHDFDTALGLLADNAMITFQESRTPSLRGSQQIREFLEVAGLDGPPLITMSRLVEGNRVIWSERFDSQMVLAGDRTVQAIVEDGKIKSLLYRAGSLNRGPGPPAARVTPEKAAAVLAALVLLGFGLLSLVSVRSAPRSDSTLRGRLMRDLRSWHTRPGPAH